MNTKEKLIQSALKLFNEKWFEATSTTSICRDAGFSSGALFVHFKTKNELLDFLYLDIKKQYFHTVFDNLDLKLDFNIYLDQVTQKSIEYYMNDFDKFIFIDRFWNSPHIWRIAKEEISQEMHAFYTVFDEWKKQGIIIDQDNSLLLSMTSWVFHSLIKYFHENKITDYENYYDLFVKWIKN